MTTHEDKPYWVALSKIERIGPQKFKRLTQHFPDLQTAWQASFGELLKAGLLPKDAEAILEAKKQINPDREWEKLEKLNIKVITVKEKEYPRLLKEIYSPPALLYIKGNLPANLDFTLAVVGTRKITTYGQQITPEIVKDLAGAGLVIVSGLALGVDALAHQSCLEAGGKTIAILGSGLDLIYPVSNHLLAEKIIENGAIVSEYPLGAQPLKQHFPARNRIISGLSLGTLVIEGDRDSGSLITARFALEQNREVFAVPGSVYNQASVGPNNLIKMGAKPVTSAIDILEALNLELAQEFMENKKIMPDTQEEEILLPFLSREPVHVDELIKKSKLNTSIVNSTLIMMEMKGKVRNLGGMNYVLSR